MRGLFSVLLTLWASVSAAQDAVLRIDYPGFTLWLDCAERGAVMFHYQASADNGNLPREHDFAPDPGVAAGCQQHSGETYRNGPGAYDRGHLVPANHLDHLEDGIAASNFMTNILPQAANMNRGAWLATEEIVECHRDVEPLEVWGGVLWGFNPHDDAFVESHGVRTPDYFWKVVIAADNPARHIAWIVPNVAEARRDQLDRYIVTVETVERATGMQLPLPALMKRTRPLASWALPDECDRS